MHNRISLRLRLTIVTSLILTLVCAVFQLSSIYNANATLSAAVATIPAVEGTIAAQAIVPSIQTGQWDDMAQLEMVQMHTQQFSQVNLWYMLGIVVAGSVVMYFAAGLILRPLHKLSTTIAGVDPQGLSTRIEDYKAKDELNTLATAFNQMMDRLHRAFERERRFSADAAHELKTPLTVMKINIEVLDETAEIADYQNALSVVKKQADRMTALVNQLLEFSAMQGSAFTERVPVAELVSAVLKEQCGQNATSSLHYCTIAGDSLLLKQAVGNLVQNALKYGDGTVNAQVKEENGFVYISIEDQGKGVPLQEREKIFEPFYRADKSRSRALGGSGLGLSLVADIAKLHGGTVSCEAAKTGGARFVIQLPK